MSEQIVLKQMIPTLGEVQVELFEPAASIYRLFEKREVPRLRKLRQLGQLAHIHTGAHHTRWDYILLKLYLLKVFKMSCPGSGLSNEVSILNLKSGLQAIQAYSLLRNYGHLDGCFETERVVLEVFLNSPKAREMLISLVPQDFKEWAHSLIEEEAMFQFYQLLSVVFLKHSHEFDDNQVLRNQCLELLHKFYVKGDNRIQILKQRHREIRTLAYLSLDTHYSPIGVEFNLPAIILSARDFGQRLFGSSASGFQRLNSNIMDYVTDTVYMSPSACWVFAEFRKRKYGSILNKMEKFARAKPFYEYLENLKMEAPKVIPRARPVFVRIPLRSAYQPPKANKGITKLHELGIKFMIEDSENIGIACIPSGRIPHAYLYLPLGLTRKRGTIATRFRILCEHLATMVSMEERILRKYYQGFSLSKIMCASLDSLFRGLLYMLTDDRYEVLIERAGIQERHSGICAHTRASAQKQINEILEVKYIKQLDKERFNEIKCIETAIKKTFGGAIAVCLSRLKFVRKPEYKKAKDEEYEVGEVDGAILVANKRHSKLFLIESKRQVAGSVADAKEKLKSLVQERLNIPSVFKNEMEDIIELPRQGACLPIKLP